MLGQNPHSIYQISKYFNEKVNARKAHVHKAVYIVAKVVQDILKEVEGQEPRFISTLVENNGRFEGVSCHSDWFCILSITIISAYRSFAKRI
jgi:hypothetical protein